MSTQSKEVEYYQTRERSAGRERRSGVSVGVARRGGGSTGAAAGNAAPMVECAELTGRARHTIKA